MSVQIDQLFARAETAFRNNRAEEARATLHKLLPITGEHPAVLHLLALVERQAGHSDAATSAFRRALRTAPDDPQINNNYASLLADLGDPENALAHYDRALRQHEFVEARLNRALLLEKLDRFAPAEADARRVVASAPSSPAAHTVLGSILRKSNRLDDAAAAFETALAIMPTRPQALHGRARVALERGEPTAVSFYHRAAAAAPGDPDVLLGLASALEVEGDPQACEILDDALIARPEWLDGHRDMARMLSEAGHPSSATRTIDRALGTHPQNVALHLLHWQVLAQLGRHADALTAIRDAVSQCLVPPSDGLTLAEAICADEVGDVPLAARLFEKLDPSAPAVATAFGRHLLRNGAAERAASVLHRLVLSTPEDIAAWAHLDLAWRSIGDNRHAWLSGQPALIATRSIGFSKAEIDHLAEFLRSLHRSRAHPVGQSMRGGTQTKGALLERTEPILRQLRAALQTAATAYVGALPPCDASHPLLRYRDGQPTFAGSWSVRLSSSGFHVSHIHPQGVVSSACHISLPSSSTGDLHDGWLELGASPIELGLNLPPIMIVEPQPGVLTLFPSYLFHGTRPFAKGERLSVAFDLAFG